MASAAAAHRGARVTLFEQLEGPMELQRNNRQRWLHPRIYDWPKRGWENAKADLPLITWSEGYAENVAMQSRSANEKLRELRDHPKTVDELVQPLCQTFC